MATSAGDDFEQRKAPLEGRVVAVISYRAGDKFVSRVDNIDPATVIARGEGHSRAEAEKAALAVAQRRLAGKRPVHDTLTELHTRVASLERRFERVRRA